MSLDVAWREALRQWVHDTCFSPGPPSRFVGLEVEFLALNAADLFPVPLFAQDGRSGLVAMLRRIARQSGWIEQPGYGAVPRFAIPGLGGLSFEPGGQIEISTGPFESPAALLPSLNRCAAMLRGMLADEGVRVESIGIDSRNAAADIALQLRVPRYERMTRYFERIGPYGIRMMRQTAAIQVSVDRGLEPAARWRLLNDLAPYLTAIFANSPFYLGAPSGHQSYRAHCWRQLDVSRTGIAVPDADPAGAYTDFALAAGDMMNERSDGRALSFAALQAGLPSEEAWQTHLSTLFPEVRPRGHFEVRSCDAISPRWFAAPLVFICGLTYDSTAATEAALLASDSRVLVRSAGQAALRDEALARTARDLFQLALAGARRLGPLYVDGASLETVEAYYDEYTRRDRSPADDALRPPTTMPTTHVRSGS